MIRLKKRHIEKACSLADMEGIIDELRSPEDMVRARAVSKVCPCRMGWAGYQRAMVIVDRLRKDPSPAVRGAALHVIEESFEMVSGGGTTSRRMVTNEIARTKFRARWGKTDR